MAIEIHLVTELEKLRVRPQGPATGGIWLTINDSSFPMIGWNDFIVVVLSWWAGAILRLLQNTTVCERVHFMEGPYAVEIVRTTPERFQLRMLAGPDGGAEVALAEAEVKPLVSEFSSQSRRLLDECRARRWWSSDAEDLEASLQNLDSELDQVSKAD